MFGLNADAAASLSLHLGCLLVAILLAAALLRRTPRWRDAAVALVGLALGLAALFVDPLDPLARALGLHWNWGGKLFSTLVMLGVMRVAAPTFAEMGVRRWDGRGLGAALLCLGAMCALDWGLSAMFSSGLGLPGTERLLFQASMPGLNEELVYRGFAMAMLDRAFHGVRWQVWGAPVGLGAVLSSMFFGIQHGVGFADGHLMISGAAIALTGTLGLLLAWMRTRTDSLVAPIFAHNLVNIGHAFFR